MKRRDFISLIEKQLDNKISDPIIALNMLLKHYQSEATSLSNNSFLANPLRYTELAKKMNSILEEKKSVESDSKNYASESDNRLMRIFDVLNNEKILEEKDEQPFINLLSAFFSCYPEHYKNLTNSQLKNKLSLDFEWIDSHFYTQLTIAEQNAEKFDFTVPANNSTESWNSVVILAHGIELVERERRTKFIKHILQRLSFDNYDFCKLWKILADTIDFLDNNDKKLIMERYLQAIEKGHYGLSQFKNGFISILTEMSFTEITEILDKLCKLAWAQEKNYQALDVLEAVVCAHINLNLETAILNNIFNLMKEALVNRRNTSIISSIFSNVIASSDVVMDIKKRNEAISYLEKMKTFNAPKAWVRLLKQCSTEEQEKKANELFLIIRSKNVANNEIAFTLLNELLKSANLKIQQGIINQIISLLQTDDVMDKIKDSHFSTLILVAINTAMPEQKSLLIKSLLRLFFNTKSYNDSLSIALINLNGVSNEIQLQILEHLLEIKNDNSTEDEGFSYALLTVLANKHAEKREQIINFLLKVLNESSHLVHRQASIFCLGVIFLTCQLSSENSNIIYKKIVSLLTDNIEIIRNEAARTICDVLERLLLKEKQICLKPPLLNGEVYYLQNENVQLSKVACDERKNFVIEQLLFLSEYNVTNERNFKYVLHGKAFHLLGSLAEVCTPQQKQQIIKRLLQAWNTHEDAKSRNGIFMSLIQIGRHLKTEDQISLIREIRASDINSYFPSLLSHFSRLKITCQMEEKNVLETFPAFNHDISQLISAYTTRVPPA